MLRRRSTQACPLEGIVVRLGELSEHPVEPGHSKTSDSAVWPDVVEDFVEDFGKKLQRTPDSSTARYVHRRDVRSEPTNRGGWQPPA